jgi:carboxyl-terminal processing protease
MFKMLRLVVLLFLLFWGLGTDAVLCPTSVLAAPTDAAEESEKSERSLTPDGFYSSVWTLIRDTYYDPTYNKQDWNRWKHMFDGKLSDLDDAHKAVETMLASLGDRYTRFLNKSAFADETSAIQARLCGIGIQIGMDKTQRIIVISPIEGTPATAAGILSGDQITFVNGKSTRSMSVEEVSKMIRGLPNTGVEIVIVRGTEERRYNLVRAEIPIRSVQQAVMLNNDIGYIRLSTFLSQFANKEMQDALTTLSPARGIILDLRDNPGGLVSNAINICSMFLNGGIVVKTIDRNGNVNTSMCDGPQICRQPLALLINQGSASASEITSGALKDADRADLVGVKSFGKGLVQKVNWMADSTGVNVTIARYLTPNNVDIHKRGIVPDYVVPLELEDYKNGAGPWWVIIGDTIQAKRSPLNSHDKQLSKAVEVLEGRVQNESSPYTVKLTLPEVFFHE